MTMYFAEAYIVPAIGKKDPVSSGGWEVVRRQSDGSDPLVQPQ